MEIARIAASGSSRAADGGCGPAVISFFSGMGGLDLGLEDAGFRLWSAHELRGRFADGYCDARDRLGRPHLPWGMHQGAFSELLVPGWRRQALRAAMWSAREETGLVGFVGGPPCPDFSVAGRNAGRDGTNGRLTGDYVQCVCDMQPDFFALENVGGLRSTGAHRAFYDSLCAKLSDAGYEVHGALLNAISSGVPQDRRRVIAVGIRTASFPGGWREPLGQRLGWTLDKMHAPELGLGWPSRERFEEGGQRPRPAGIDTELTVQAWFDRNAVETHPNGSRWFLPKPGTAKFFQVDEGDTGSKSFKRLHRWRYSPTAAYGNNEVHLHPYRARRISVAEALAIQSMPPGFELPNEMSLSDMFKLVANAVPYLFALDIGRAISGALVPPA